MKGYPLPPNNGVLVLFVLQACAWDCPLWLDDGRCSSLIVYNRFDLSHPPDWGDFGGKLGDGCVRSNLMALKDVLIDINNSVTVGPVFLLDSVNTVISGYHGLWVTPWGKNLPVWTFRPFTTFGVIRFPEEIGFS